TGGIDLSIGSLIGLVGASLAWLLTVQGMAVPLALFLVLFMSLAIGFIHGVLVTKLRLQPFVVTLCGLLLYRGLARLLTSDQSIGFGGGFDGLRYLATGRIPIPFIDGFAIPLPFIIMIAIAAIAIVLLQFTIYGRY